MKLKEAEFLVEKYIKENKNSHELQEAWEIIKKKLLDSTRIMPKSLDESLDRELIRMVNDNERLDDD